MSPRYCLWGDTTPDAATPVTLWLRAEAAASVAEAEAVAADRKRAVTVLAIAAALAAVTTAPIVLLGGTV